MKPAEPCRSFPPENEDEDKGESWRRGTSEKWHSEAFISERPVHAPPSLAAHHRRCSIGADTTPTTTSSSTISEIRVAQTGTPRTKFLVPSMGSTTQRRWLCPVEPCSSPSTASRGRARDRVRRMPSSTDL